LTHTTAQSHTPHPQKAHPINRLHPTACSLPRALTITTMSEPSTTSRTATANSTASRSPAELLATPVQFLKGVGPDRAKFLERLGLRPAADVLFNFPRDYQDLTDLRSLEKLEEDKLQS